MQKKKKVTIRDLAVATGVSIGTISRALKNQPGLSEQTRRDVRRAAQKLGYDVTKLRKDKNSHGLARREGRPRRILFLFNRAHASLRANPFFSVVLQGVEDACRDEQVTLSLLSVGPGDAIQTRVLRQDPDALLVVGYFDLDMLDKIKAVNLPTAMVVHQAPFCFCVNDDNQRGGWLATRHLIDQGYQRIAMIMGPLSHPSVEQRLRGYRKALYEAGRLANPDLEVSMDMSLPYNEAAMAAMNKLLALPQRPDAVFAYNDETALNAMEACRKAGLSIPKDIAFVGYDDIAAAATSRPSLTTIWVDKEALGNHAAKRLIAGDASPGEELLPVELLIRESSIRA